MAEQDDLRETKELLKGFLDENTRLERVIESHAATLAIALADRDRYKAALEQIASDDDTHHDWWARDIALEALGKAGENG